MDIADLSWPIPLFKSEDRHGLVHLVRYRVARKFGQEIPVETLEYLDMLADAFIHEAEQGTSDIRTVVSQERLGLTKLKHFPDEIALRAAFGDISRYEEKRPFRAALRQAELIQSGMSADAASQRVCEELSYSEARKVKEAAKNYAAPVKAVLERRERDRRLAEYIELERAADLITNDLLEACKTINKSTPRVSLLLSSRYYERPEIQVTFPPNRQALARRLGKLDADDPTVEWDIAAICIAGEYGYSVSDVRAAFNAWAVPDRHAFTAAARDHLRRVGVAETPAAHSA